MSRILACLSGLVILIVSFFIYAAHIAFLGMPDGFITEVEHAQEKLFTIFIYISIVLSLYFFSLGLIKQKKFNKKLYITIAAYISLIIISFIINYYIRFYSGLMNGSGG